MSSQTIASYLPDSQLLRLGVDLPAFCDIANPRGFKGGREIAYVFHEWIHYLHNVSTIHGLSAFANFVHLWSEFRRTIGADGLSLGSDELPNESKVLLRQKVAFTATARQARPNAIPGSPKFEMVKVVSVEAQDVPLPDSDISTRIIKLGLQIGNNQGDHHSASAEIGSHEIIESLAFMLERQFTLKAGGEPAPVKFLPYQLLKALAFHVAPSLNDVEVICCGITSLQCSNPPSSVVEILEFAQAEKVKGSDVNRTLWARQLEELERARPWVEEQLTVIDEMFPVDEPMAHAIRETVQAIRDNFEFRRRIPFFELGVMTGIVSSGGNFASAIEAHGACGVFQQCPGLDDDLGRDRIYEFKIGSEDRSALNKGRRLMHAAFHFIRLHPMGGAIRPTAALSLTRKNACPFYTVCTLKTRVETPDVCAEKPWMTAHRSQADLCWYGEAVRLVSPPEIAASLAIRFDS